MHSLAAEQSQRKAALERDVGALLQRHERLTSQRPWHEHHVRPEYNTNHLHCCHYDLPCIFAMSIFPEVVVIAWSVHAFTVHGRCVCSGPVGRRHFWRQAGAHKRKH